MILDSEFQSSFKTELNGTKPLTDESSKTVMIVAERRDKIRIDDIIHRFQKDIEIPDELSVIRRCSKYYGPELLLNPAHADRPVNYRLSAPGPSSFLHLWRAQSKQSKSRDSYTLVAEVRATILDGSYKTCPDCGKPFKSRRHEQLAAVGRCPNE